jgi:hypothetical protein
LGHLNLSYNRIKDDGGGAGRLRAEWRGPVAALLL